MAIIARVFAETGVKDLFRKILELVGGQQNAPRIVRLRNGWVPMDPRNWNTQMDVSINVGLGTGNKDQMLLHLQNLLGIQVQAVRFQGGVNGPLVTLENIYNTLAKLVENAGLKSADPYFTAPTRATATPTPPAAPPGAAAAPPQPDPRLLALQQRAQLDAARLEFERQRAAADLALDRTKLAAELALKRDELALRAHRAGLAG
jgi:hypothetical protein